MLISSRFRLGVCLHLVMSPLKKQTGTAKVAEAVSSQHTASTEFDPSMRAACHPPWRHSVLSRLRSDPPLSAHTHKARADGWISFLRATDLGHVQPTSDHAIRAGCARRSGRSCTPASLATTPPLQLRMARPPRSPPPSQPDLITTGHSATAQT